MSHSSENLNTRSRLCDCGHLGTVKTSWTNDNPGRRFLICERIECGKFKWWDPPMCSRSKAITPGLLRRLNRHEMRWQSVGVYGVQIRDESVVFMCVGTNIEQKNTTLF
ncbi:hypothetical protein BUALT_Bualt03G0222400 [Buddleja alternifolia]|uniref:GRF-type domain-containing protein n=1 Tax=Buddleja alternifolia TaxID=168488 RepID=A0AAV6XVU0_9LAMI|nr:hypothetical protein BUALT_Bualt03G0222400 [Buddleja alternifolia]